jgi:hypothetical protein
MQWYARLLTAILTAGLVAGCVTTTQKVAPEKMSQIRSIGVIVAMNEEVHFLEPGLTIFDNKRISFPVPAWGLNESAAEATIKALSPRFETTIVQSRMKGQSFDPFGPGLTLPKLNTDDFMAALEPHKPVDAYLLIVRDPSLSGGGHPSFVSKGSYGLIADRERPPAFSFKFAFDKYLSALLIEDYFLIDASSHAVLTSYSARSVTKEYQDAEGKMVPLPVVVPSQPDAMQREPHYLYIRDVYRRLMAENTVKALTELQLSP